MSGIIGYFGNRQALPAVLQGVKLVKDYYYDSIGLILKGRRGLYIKKAIGGVENLESQLINYQSDEKIGVAHLRWATHGDVEEKNVHPFFGCQKKIAIMHKGIIENYAPLKKMLIEEGHVFVSDTDSEVLAHLIEKNYFGDLYEAVRQTLIQIAGTYLLVVLCDDQKDEIVLANKGMGLLLGIGEQEYWFTNNKTVLRPFTDRVVLINDDEVVKINKSGFVSSIVGGGGINVVSKTIETLDYANHDDFQLKNIEQEIFEHPDMIKNTLAGRIDRQQLTAHFGGLVENKDILRKIDELTFVGSGGSYFAASMAKKLIEDYVAINVNCYSGLEMRNKKFLITGENSALFAISQSGMTEDTIAAVREAKQLGLNVYGITNTVGSTLAKETPFGIYLHSGPVMAKPSMRSFMSQLTIIVLLTLFFGRLKGLSPTSGKEIIRSLDNLSIQMKNILNNSFQIESIAKKYKNENDFVIVGFKYCAVIAGEVVLRMQDISDVEVVDYDLDYLKYGGIKHLRKKHVVLYLMPVDAVYEDNLKILQELKQRNVRIIVLTQEGAYGLEGLAEDVIVLPKVKEIVMPMTMTMALQMFALYLRREKKDLNKVANMDNIGSNNFESYYNDNYFSDMTPLY